MKYFEVKKEELRGSLTSGLVYSDGEYCGESEEVEMRTITTGFSVWEYNEQGMTERVVYYPVKIDTEAWTTNEDDVIKEIKEDYRPELGWQNNNW